MPKVNGLSLKQARFVEEYLVDFNSTQAAIRAGYREKAAYQTGYENLQKDYIRQAIIERIERLANISEEGTRQLLQRFRGASGIGRVSIDRKKGVIYFLQADNGLVKVGITVNIQRRMATLSTMLPYQLTILALIDCDNCPALEFVLHKHFAEKRVRGEWFQLTDEDVEWARSTYGDLK